MAGLLDKLLQSAALMGVRFYRTHLSARKGYRCAYGATTGRDTCSGVGMRVFKRAGFLRGLELLRRQFDRCALSAHAMSRPGADTESVGRYARLRPMALRGQGGFVDCDLDCLSPGPGCDIFDARAGSRGFFSGLLEAVMCCDVPCGNDDKRQARRERRVERAQSRQEQREEARRLRRDL